MQPIAIPAAISCTGRILGPVILRAANDNAICSLPLRRISFLLSFVPLSATIRLR